MASFASTAAPWGCVAGARRGGGGGGRCGCARPRRWRWRRRRRGRTTRCSGSGRREQGRSRRRTDVWRGGAPDAGATGTRTSYGSTPRTPRSPTRRARAVRPRHGRPGGVGVPAGARVVVPAADVGDGPVLVGQKHNSGAPCPTAPRSPPPELRRARRFAGE